MLLEAVIEPGSKDNLIVVVKITTLEAVVLKYHGP